MILFGTRYFGGTAPLDGLSAAEREHFTFDRRRIREADAVVFHIPNCWPSAVEDTPKYRGQLWIAWSLESEINYPQLADPKFMARFDLEMTYRRDADIFAPYLPRRRNWQGIQGLPPAKDPSMAPVVMFQSAKIDKSGRYAFAAQLMRHVRVDSYGRFLHNRDLPVPDEGRATKLATIGAYRFCLAQENSITPDYVTEKLFDPLMAGAVPIYRGAPNAREYAPDHSYIDADAYGGVEGLAAYLRHLCETPDEYQAYLAWRLKPLPPALSDLVEASETPPLRRLLAIVRQRMMSGRRGAFWPSFPFGIRAAAKARLARRFRDG